MRTRNSLILSWIASLVLAMTGLGGAAAEFKPAPAVASTPPAFSPWTTEVLRLARAGLDETVLLSYVDAAGTFNPTPEQIISLRDAGVSDAVICGILQHDADIMSGVRTVEASTVPLPKPARPAFSLAADAAPASAPNPVAQAAASGAVSMTTPSDLPLDPSASLDDDDSDVFLSTAEGMAPVAPERDPRIREPYAVRLTDPIVMVRAPARIPNLVVVLGPN